MEILAQLGDLLWGGTWKGQRLLLAPPMIVALLGAGVFLMARLRGRPFRLIIWAVARAARETQIGTAMSPLRALATALGGQIGVGKIVGVATAISLGGPGAVLWMWVTALLGTALAFSESALAIHYRVIASDEMRRGGPMAYIRLGLGPNSKWLSVLFCLGTLAASLGATALIQSNAFGTALVDAGANLGIGVPPIIAALCIATLVLVAVLGGLKRVGAVASWLTPLMASAYVVTSVAILALNAELLPETFELIFASAFGLGPALGGVAGYGLIAAMRAGVARGLAANEAGQGTTPIVHAASSTDDPRLQGALAALGVLIDTMLVCSMTALVILAVPGDFNGAERAWLDPSLEGGAITAAAFGASFPGGSWVVTIATLLFAYTTLTTWHYYAEQALIELAGRRAVYPFRFLWAGVVFLGALQPIETVWKTGDFAIALMTIPNLVALLALSGAVAQVTNTKRQ